MIINPASTNAQLKRLQYSIPYTTTTTTTPPSASTPEEAILLGFQPYDDNLYAIANLTGTTGILRKTGAGIWTLDNSTYLTGINSTLVTTALGYTPENAANKGIAGGYASLDGGGLIPASQLPSYVDDVLEYANLAAFPNPGVQGKIYVDISLTKIYRWSGSTYIEITPTVGESDPVFVASPAYVITNTNISHWNTAYGWGNHASAGYLTSFTETDPVFLASAAAGITTTNISNWNTAYGWGNHGTAGYLTSFTETDPVWTAEKINYYTKTQADARYLQSFTETDPIYTASSWYSTTNNAGNWNTAYSWGNHASAGYAVTTAGTINYVPRYTASNTLGSSIIYASATGVGINTTVGSGQRFSVGGYGTGAASYKNIISAVQIFNDVTEAMMYYSQASIISAPFTLNHLYHYVATEGSLSGSATVTNQYGFYVTDSLYSAVNNYAFYGNVIVGTGRWNIYMAGTAANYMNGSLSIGTTATTYKVNIAGDLNLTTGSVFRINGSQISTANVLEGANLYYTDTRARAAISSTVTGLTYNTTTGVLSLTAGYSIPTTASQTNWDTAYGWGNHATAGYLTTSSANSIYQPLLSLTSGYVPKATGTSTLGNSTLINDATGNLGLGVTPSAWASGQRAFDFGTIGSVVTDGSAVTIDNNRYYDGVSNKYKVTGPASIYNQVSGQHIWYTAPSGTAGTAITFTQAMTLDASGNLGLGISTPLTGGGASKWITLDGTTYGGGLISSVSGTIKGYLYYENASTNFIIQGAASVGVGFWTNNSERARITSGGNFLIGTSTNSGYLLDVNGTGRFVGVLTVGNGTDSAFLTTNRGTTSQNNGVLLQTGGSGNWIIGSGAIAANNNLDFYNYLLGGSVFSLNYSTGAATFSSSVTSNGDITISKATPALYLTPTSGTNGIIYNTGASIRIANASGTTPIIYDTSTGDVTFTGDVVNIYNTDIQIGRDTTYSTPYMAVGFGGRTNGYNKITGARDATDGLYLASATGRGIYFQTNGAALNALILASSGAATFANEVTVGTALRFASGGYVRSEASYGFTVNDSTNAYNNLILYNNGNAVIRGDVTSGGVIIAGTGSSSFPYLNGKIKADYSQNSPISTQVINQFNGSSAAAYFAVSAYGNSWYFGLGSSTSTYGNDFVLRVDASSNNTPYLRVSSATGAATFSSTITAGGLILNALSNSPFTNSAIVKSASGAGMFLTNNSGSAWMGIKTDDTLSFNGAAVFNQDLTVGGIFRGQTASNSANFLSILNGRTDTYSGIWYMQAGGGSSGFGGGLVLHGHSHATKPGWVTAGISAGSGGKFSINNWGIGGGTDVFTVDASGNMDIFGDITTYGKFTSTIRADGGVNINSALGVYFYSNVLSPPAISGMGHVSGGLKFLTTNSGSMTEKLRLTDVGNLLLGTTTDYGYKFYNTGSSYLGGKTVMTAYFTTYTPDGLFNANATPVTVETPASNRIRFGYLDQGGGQYWGRVGFVGNTNWSLGTAQGGNTFSIGMGYNGTEFSINNSGYVGIGTANATGWLGIYDTVYGDYFKIAAGLIGGNQTSVYLAWNNGGTISLQQVVVGAADSGGTGYRLLRIPN